MPLAPGGLKAMAAVFLVTELPASSTPDNTHLLLVSTIIGGILTSATGITIALIQRSRRDNGSTELMTAYERQVVENARLQSELNAEKAKHRRGTR